MSVKSKVLSAGVLFFLGGQMMLAQKAKNDTVQKEKKIEEVVIVGYSAVKKEDFTGAVGVVKTENISKKSASNVAQALTGEIAGVRVITTSGQPGSDPSIRVRGFGSVNGSRDPLYVVDGVPFNGSISSLNQEDIQSFNVLKDAAATSIYGSRGANGVVLITTKKGRANRDMLMLESKIGFNTPLIPRYDVIRSPEQYIGLVWESLYNRGRLTPNVADPVAFANDRLFSNLGIRPKYNMWDATAAELIDPVTRQVRAGVARKYDPENWKDYAFQTSIRTEHNLSISGGAGKTTYYAGLGYLKDEGYSINSKYERYSGRLNLSHQAKPWLRGEFNMGYAFSKTLRNGQSENSNSVFWLVDNMPSIYPLFLRDSQGRKVVDPHYGGYQYDYGEGRGFAALTNAIANALYNSDSRDRHEINANFFLKADIVKGLSFETRLGGQYYNNSRNIYQNPYYGPSVSQNGSLDKVRTEMFSYNWLQMLRYMNRFGSHGLQAFVAHETTDWQTPILEVSKYGLINPRGTEFNNAINQNPAYSYVNNYALESYFGQLMYDFDNKYLLQASVRRDGSSRFLLNKWDTFYSLGLGWVLKKENFLKDVDFINRLKLRASYGTVGEQAGIGYYPGYSIYDPGNFMGLPAAVYNRDGYPNLTWEKRKVLDAGIEFALSKKRVIEGSVDVYHQTTDNLIFDSRIPPSTGNAILKVNQGSLVNKGVEFTLTGNIVNNDNFFLSVNVNGERTKNVLTAMPIDNTTGKPKIIDLSESGFGRAEGYSLYDFYMREWAGVNRETGAAQWVLHYNDLNDDGKYNVDTDVAITSLFEYQKLNPNAKIGETTTEDYSKATQKFVGKSALPDLRGAFGFKAGYKAISLDVQFLYGIGGYAYDSQYASLMHNGGAGSNNWHTDILQRWTTPGQVTDVPRLSNNRDLNYNSLSTRFLTKSDFIALNNVKISYDLPKDFANNIGLAAMSLSVAGDNLWISTRRKGFNPTTSETGNSSSYRYSPLSTFTFGVKLSF
ncbi:SusC/RagA family TonB-linked outer membrane protein [Bergeyella zoohelcum]|uniref:Outer membrane cobalamin receptor protein n=1 Tax=Bergeyella zoohelcum TaxID=1015 RepID=A0A7Z9CG22_9FLAO|nr:SusC/RagA family TonB-linked outer membrane protein [Bergeyella zoohelcum]VDH04030.1 Outer membrane cobalamin receptor protein [Bergeyella zoohelcum]